MFHHGCGPRANRNNIRIAYPEVGSWYGSLEGDNTAYLANCGYCDGCYSVVLTEGDDYICVNCFDNFDSLEYCQWCYGGNTGDMGSSYAFGCNMCEGSLGWHKAD